MLLMNSLSNSPLRHDSPLNLLLDVVEHLALRLHHDSHVQENLMQLHQALLQVLHAAVALLDLCKCVQDMSTTLWDVQSGGKVSRHVACNR